MLYLSANFIEIEYIYYEVKSNSSFWGESHDSINRAQNALIYILLRFTHN